MSDCCFLQPVLNIHARGVVAALFGSYMAGASRNCCHLSTFCVHRTTMHHITSLHANHVPRVHACLAITGHLHFWQNDHDFLHATAVTWGWNRYRNKSTKSWPWRRKISRCSCWYSNPQPFDHKSSALTTELSPLPFIWSLLPVEQNLSWER